MKVVIAGSRHITDRMGLVKAIKQSGFEITEVVSGTSRGVDSLGEAWARANEIPIKEMPANWSKFGNYAGPLRNSEMAKYADAAIILWDGKSAGTLNMIKNMVHLDKPYFIRMVFNEL
jgi:hypothetical protein